MDGVHIRVTDELGNDISSLNPCCNGWCTHTTTTLADGITMFVLILVVMDGVHIIWH